MGGGWEDDGKQKQGGAGSEIEVGGLVMEPKVGAE